MVIKMSPISKTYKSYTGSDFAFLFLFFFSSKPKKYKLTFEETKIVSCA